MTKIVSAAAIVAGTPLVSVRLAPHHQWLLKRYALGCISIAWAQNYEVLWSGIPALAKVDGTALHFNAFSTTGNCYCR